MQTIIEEDDVVVVGSGAGGGTIACALAEAGLDVVILEEGALVRTRDFTSDPRHALLHLYRDAGASLMFGRPPIFFSEGRCVGGSTVINGGMSWRTPERILRRWQWQEGIEGIERDAEPLFDQVEQIVHVAPQNPGTIGQDSVRLKAGADALGYESIDAMRSQHDCMGSNNCGFGCPTGGKQSMLVTTIPRALAAGARLYPNCRAQRVQVEGDRAVGIEARFEGGPGVTPGPRMQVRARHVVLSCGAVQTPALLSRSRVGLGSGQVGRNLLSHPNGKVIGVFPDAIEGWRGTIQGWQIREFIEEGILITTTNVPPALLAMSMARRGLDVMQELRHYNRMLVAGCLVEDSQTGRVLTAPGGRPVMRYDLSDYDLHRILLGISHTAEIMFAAGAERVLVPIHGFPDLRSPDDLPRLMSAQVDRRSLEVLTVHAMGTCRMGADPRQSVVDPWGQSHEVAGLHVADASVFPSAIGVNPQLTIMMLALRTAQAILGSVPASRTKAQSRPSVAAKA